MLPKLSAISAAILFAVVALIWWNVASSSEWYEKALAADNRSDYVTVMSILESRVYTEDPKAQNYMGYMYLNGRGVPQNFDEAFKWFNASAQQGFGLGEYNLGRLYLSGKGVASDKKEALKWLSLAAGQGEGFALLDLGSMYRKGDGVKRDLVQAHTYFNLAVVHLQSQDSAGRAQAIANRDQVTAEMTREQIARAQQLAAEWKPSS